MNKEEIVYAISISRVSSNRQNEQGDSLDDQSKQIDQFAVERLTYQLGKRVEVVERLELAESASVESDNSNRQMPKENKLCDC